MKMTWNEQKFLIDTIADALDDAAILISDCSDEECTTNKRVATAKLVHNLKTLLLEINKAEIEKEVWF